MISLQRFYSGQGTSTLPTGVRYGYPHVVLIPQSSGMARREIHDPFLKGKKNDQ